MEKVPYRVEVQGVWGRGRGGRTALALPGSKYEVSRKQ